MSYYYKVSIEFYSDNEIDYRKKFSGFLNRLGVDIRVFDYVRLDDSVEVGKKGKLHRIQRKLLDASKTNNFDTMTYREIGEKINEIHPYKIKYHLDRLKEKKLI